MTINKFNLITNIYSRNIKIKSNFNKRLNYKIVDKIKTSTKNISFDYNNKHMFSLQFKQQNYYLFIKRKFGLYKSTAIENKIVKKQLVYLSHLIKKKTNKKINKFFFKKTKIIFYKKINKLFFRAGRALFLNIFKTKKTYTQTFLSKRIVSVIKNNWTHFTSTNSIIILLLNTNLFYTHGDTIAFVSNFGILINNKITYDPSYKINNLEHFSFCFNKKILIFFFKKRRKAIFNLKNIKFYKFRSKIFSRPFKNMWIPSSEWIYEHSFIYLYKNSNIEFDLRVLTGLVIYNYKFCQFSKFINNTNISLFMSRSYNWKYIV